MIKPSGGDFRKIKSNPRLLEVPKLGAVAYDAGENVPDADEATLIATDSLKDGLVKANLNKELEGVKDLSGEEIEASIHVNTPADLEEKGIREQIPMLQELHEQKMGLHKLAQQLDGEQGNYRVQRFLMDSFFFEEEDSEEQKQQKNNARISFAKGLINTAAFLRTGESI